MKPAPVCLFALLLVGGCSDHAPPADAAPTGAAAADADDSGPGVTVADSQAKRLGIELAATISAPATAVSSGTAVVLDSAALVSALDEIAAAAADSAAQNESRQRIQHLYDDGGNASLQALEAARSQAAQARARLTAAESRARVDWGRALVDAREPRLRPVREMLKSGRGTLLRAEFPGSLAGDPAALEYSLDGANGSAGHAIAAQFIDLSKAPTQSASGVAVILAVTDAGAGNFALRPGLRLSVTVSARAGPVQTLVPAAAVIADSGQLWCYVARAQGRFDRIAVDGSQRVGQGYAAPPLAAGDRVVVRGAPLLLSLERGAGAGAAPADED
jgi:hypothetical protein